MELTNPVVGCCPPLPPTILCSLLVALLMVRHVKAWVQQLCARHPTIAFTLIVVTPASSTAILFECKVRDLPVAQRVNRDGGSALTSKLAEIAQH